MDYLFVKRSKFLRSKRYAMSSLSYLFVLLTMTMVTYLEAMSSISITPLSTPGFKEYKTFGQWFAVYVYPPCNEAGRLNEDVVYSSVGKNALKATISWENDGFCNTVTLKKVMVSPGVYLTDDFAGNVFSSKSVVVKTDYKSSLILWICNKFNAFGDECDEPFILILSRTPRPNAKTIGKIDANLKSIWGINMNDVRKVVHTGECYSGKSSWTFYKGKMTC